jgi:hypothetical protein
VRHHACHRMPAMRRRRAATLPAPSTRAEPYTSGDLCESSTQAAAIAAATRSGVPAVSEAPHAHHTHAPYTRVHAQRRCLQAQRAHQHGEAHPPQQLRTRHHTPRTSPPVTTRHARPALGVDGEPTRTRTYVLRCHVRVTLAQGAQRNAFYKESRKAQRPHQDGSGAHERDVHSQILSQAVPTQDLRRHGS